VIATPSPIPPPRPDDDEDVHWALSTASALWARGDAAESIKWLRRAAETASDQNRDQRSLELFKAAADATSLVRPAAPTAPFPAPPAPNAPPRAATGPMGTISMQIPPGANAPGAPPHAGQPQQPQTGHGGQGAGQSPPPPQVRPSAPMPPPQASPPGRAPVPQRTSVPGPPPGAGGPPAGTARAAAAQANAQAQATRGPGGFSPQRPAGSPVPAAVSNARQILKATLPSEGAVAPSRAPVPAARPSPGTGVGAPSSAAKRADAKKPPLDARFQFPDEEVTVQRDLAALKKPRPVHTDLAEEAAASAATQRAPVVASPPVARTLISTTAGGVAAGASGATVRGLQPIGRAPAVHEIAPPAGHAIANEPTDHEHTPIDDLDEQTSVLAGDEPELDFEGSATGETSAAMLASIEQNVIERSQLEEQVDAEASDANLEEGVTGEESSDPRHGGLSVPSVRPEPMPRPVAAAGTSGVGAWPAVRVAVRRDASGVRVEALARGVRPAPGAIAAVLVAQDDATADALAKLLDG
jgi:hypothetical protein